MPELAEVKIMGEVAKKYYVNSKLKDIDILYTKYKRKGMPKHYDALLKALPLKITDVDSKGKFLWITLEKEWTIWIIPSMTGHLQPESGDYNKVIFETTKGKLYFDDMRNFGQIFFCNKTCDLDKKLSQLGPDVLKEKVEPEYLINRLKKLKQTQYIADVLLNQKVLAGVGNYIRADALYLSKISPFRKLKDLSTIEIELLLKNIKKVITKSYNCQIKIAFGDYDYHQLTRCYKFYVYGREKTTKGEIVTNDKMKNDRTIWWVPSVQQ
tara:strand:+ start:7790 stop:8593 length:804 start_codon:yes stop_codon:yes gene_type:complete